MDRTLLEILETIEAARSVMAHLQVRVSNSRDVLDVGDLSVIHTTVRKLEELLQSAGEYEELLRRQLARTAARGVPTSP